MGQIKIYGHERFLRSNIPSLSDALHEATVAVLGLPREKRFHRFMPLAEGTFLHPESRSERYLIVEVLMFAGRSADTKRAYLKRLGENLHERCGIPIDDVEITLIESPPSHWWIRGTTGDSLKLDYDVQK